MHVNRRNLILSGVATSVSMASPWVHAQAKGARKLMLGQSVPLTGAADQIGLAYFNGAKMYFDAINAKNGAAGYKIEVKTLDDGYNATKAAVWMYTKTIALEAAKGDWNVRCNSVHPVFIKTPILDPFIAMAGGDEAKAHERLSRGIPMKRIGEPDDVAYCVLYLAADESKFVTGSEFNAQEAGLRQLRRAADDPEDVRVDQEVLAEVALGADRELLEAAQRRLGGELRGAHQP